MRLNTLLLSLIFFSCVSLAKTTQSTNSGLDKLSKHKWLHGSSLCQADNNPAIELYQFSATTYLLRQNKCTHYEAPFIYVLFGSHTVFVQDTGATSDPVVFPLFETIKMLVQHHATEQNKTYDDYKWLVTHSHSHSDHIAGDEQFRNRKNVTLIEANLAAVQQAFNLDKATWPNKYADFNLGDRSLIVVPLPGHKSDAIAVYDKETEWLLTGDSLYPGRLYVKDWKAFRASIQRLKDFAVDNPISALMGTHIEMSKTPGQDYKMGSTYQPNEAALPMSARDLSLLNEIMQSNISPSKVVTERFIVFPVAQ